MTVMVYCSAGFMPCLFSYFLKGCVWNMGVENENQKSFSILISNGMESII